MSLKTGRASGVSADNAHGVIRPTGRSGCRRAPGPPESLAGLATAPGFSSPTPPARRRTSPAGGAGIAQGAQFVEADAGEDFHAAQPIGAAACSSSLARSARALAPTVDALPLMVCRVAALPWTSPSPSWRSSWAKRSCISGTKRRNTDDQLQAAAETPDDIARASTSSPASAVVAGAPCRRSCRDDRADKAPGAPCRSASPHGRSCPPPGRPRSASEALAVMAEIGSPAKRPSARIRRVASRPSISGICMSISTASNGTLASSTC